MKLVDLLKRAWTFTFANKNLWLLGFILALFIGGSSSKDMTQEGQNIRYKEVETAYNSVIQSVRGIDLTILVVIAVVIMIVGIAFAILAWYIQSIASAGLVHASLFDLKGNKTTLGEAWGVGTKIALRVMLLELIIGVFALITFLPFFLLMSLIFAIRFDFSLINVAYFAVIPFAIYGVLIAILWITVSNVSLRLLMINNSTAWQTFKDTFVFIFDNKLSLLKTLLVAAIPGLTWLIISSSFLSNIPLALAIIGTPYVILMTAYWTFVVNGLIEKTKTTQATS